MSGYQGKNKRGIVLNKKGREVAMIALILSIIAFVVAVVNLIFITRR